MDLDIQALKDAYGAGGWLAVAAAAVTFSVKWYRHPAVQAVVGSFLPKAKWDSLGRWARIAVVALTSLVSALLSGLSAGLGWKAALLGSLPAFVGAVGAHEALASMSKASVEARGLSIVTKLPNSSSRSPS